MHALFRDARVVPVLSIERAADAVPLARALVKGGIRVVEITLRTPEAPAAIAAVAREVPEIVVGAGTILRAADVTRAVEAGARFLVSPGLTPELASAGIATGLPFVPGVATPSEVMVARDFGFSFLKFFPAEPLGGVAVLKAMAPVFPGIVFCPTGGVTAESAPRYLELPNVAMVGGSWMAPADAIAARDWSRIAELARAAASLGR
ncbi:MAG: bifunctional 4-hydroxy-2-oxoglutarate aldolase/2-dehydro-3-deoxy-phosphogluconate aldolase [Rhodospirillales bacterium]|nr:bifunctional 4-hydroxy-2-oxoglutarate aldolase/2-dehydro-3-deoxy-phosphogluconate aldolase [Rhodospirillales bacterium]